MDRSQVDPEEVREKYNGRPEIWDEEDVWHAYTGKKLEEIVCQAVADLALNEKAVLNVGSAGSTYGLDSENHFHLDIAERLLPRGGKSVAGSAEALPFLSGSFDAVICVGSVINYCDAVPVCRETARVLRPGGWLLLEFESSESGEYLWKPGYSRMVNYVTTSYLGQEERLWLYAPVYLKALLDASGLIVKDDVGFHVSTVMAYRLLQNIERSMNWASLDRFALVRRLLRRFACNRVLLAQKST
jgi:SAM-dependent methyltransferase